MKRSGLSRKAIRDNAAHAIGHPGEAPIEKPRLFGDTPPPAPTPAPVPDYRHPAPDPEVVKEWLAEHADAEPKVRLEPTLGGDVTPINHQLDEAVAPG